MAPKTTSRRTPSRTERRQQALHRRRQQTAARTKAARRAHRRKRRLQGFGIFVVLALAAGGGGFLLLRGGDSSPSKALRAKKVSATGRLAIAALPTAYHAVYKAEAYSGTKATVSTEEITVNRPFEGNVAIREGAPPGQASQFEGRSDFGIYANYTQSGAPQIAGDTPTVALGDVRVAASLDELVDEGLFVPGARRKALNRECQTYRTGSPLQSLKITAPTATDYVDVCLDETGLIIEEVAVAGGKLTQRLTATTVELEPTVDPAGFTIEGDHVGPDQGGAEVTEVDRNTAPTPGYWTLGSPPAGFTQKGRYMVAGAHTSYVDVYVRGIDIVTVEQGAPDAEPDLSDAGPGKDVDLGTLGAGKMLLRSIGPTMIAHPGGSAFVHVAGTLSPAELTTIATSLRQS